MSGDSLPLERITGEVEAPRVIDAHLVEDATVTPRRVPGAPTAGFAAFLDGVQVSHPFGRVGCWPIVVGRVAAAIRERVDRRLVTWGRPLSEWRIYAPLSLTGDDVRRAYPHNAVVDTSVAGDDPVAARHPVRILENARSAVQADRERTERALAEQWCRDDARPLLIDGTISTSEAVARAPCAVGVVKTHRSLYAPPAMLEAVLGLGSGQRSSVVRIAPRNRSPVYSWYLRLREPDGYDALWGLVRVEVAPNDDPTERADTVSRWVMAELTPLALPDPDWDRMVYGVRDCETYLRAIG